MEQSIKELQELVTVFQAEEAEEEVRQKRRDAALARKVQVQVQQAVEAHEVRLSLDIRND